MRKVQPAALFLIFILGLLVSCQAEPAPTNNPTAPKATDSKPTPDPDGQVTISGPTEGIAEPAITTMAEELIINEDVQRSLLFNINTLVYELPGMDEVEVDNITFAYRGDQPLTMDVYYPAVTAEGAQLPVVIFGLGYRMSVQPLRDAHFYSSWGKLVAAAGMVAISYDTEQPDEDLEVLLEFIRDNAAGLGIDSKGIGFFASSANVPTVMSYIMQEGRDGIQFSVYYYGITLTPDRQYTEALAKGCAGRGCLVAELADVTYVDPDLPVFMVKAGRDFLPDLNEAMDYFVDYLREEGAPITLVEYEDGRHGFDTEQETEEAAEIIAQTLEFMRLNFGIEPGD